METEYSHASVAAFHPSLEATAPLEASRSPSLGMHPSCGIGGAMTPLRLLPSLLCCCAADESRFLATAASGHHNRPTKSSHFIHVLNFHNNIASALFFNCYCFISFILKMPLHRFFRRKTFFSSYSVSLELYRMTF